MRRFEAIISGLKNSNLFCTTFWIFYLFNFFQKFSRVPKWLKTFQGVQFDNLFQIKKCGLKKIDEFIYITISKFDIFSDKLILLISLENVLLVLRSNKILQLPIWRFGSPLISKLDLLTKFLNQFINTVLLITGYSKSDQKLIYANLKHKFGFYETTLFCISFFLFLIIYGSF